MADYEGFYFSEQLNVAESLMQENSENLTFMPSFLHVLVI